MTIAVLGAAHDELIEHWLGELVDRRFASRLFAKDVTLWGPAAEAEAAIRLGWIDAPQTAPRIVAEAEALRAELEAMGVDRIVLCGMGGSSLAPLVITPSLIVLDSTHPDAVREVLSGDLARTAVVVSSKSGSTIETLYHRAVFEEAFAKAGIAASSRIVVITDPGSALEISARERGQCIVLADPCVGGRFSALTAFGLVPAVLAGTDVSKIVEDAAAARALLSADDAANPALALAAAIRAGLPARLVLEVRSRDEFPDRFGLWIEQLIAESTGKDGVGVLPIALPRSSMPSDGAPEAVQRVALDDRDSGSEPPPNGELLVTGTLGEQFLLWEAVAAALGFLLGINPFDQPDVEAAKIAAREMLGTPLAADPPPPAPEALLPRLARCVPPGGYLGIQAYSSPLDERLRPLLEALRERLSQELAAPVTLGWGPRYLHSTGQMHKGGPALGAFLQLVDTAGEDIPVPGEGVTFGQLLRAQACGDATVLRERGRSVLAIASDDLAGYLEAVLAA